MLFIVFPTDLKCRILVNDAVGEIEKRVPEKGLRSKDFLGRRSGNGANLPYEYAYGIGRKFATTQ